MFCGVNDEGLASRAPRDLYTGVRELFAVDGIVSLATTLRPATRESLVVTDASTTSAAAGDEHCRQLAARRHDLTFRFLDGRTALVARYRERSAARSSSRPRSSRPRSRRTATGRYFPRDEGIAQIARASAAPGVQPVDEASWGRACSPAAATAARVTGGLAAAMALQVLAGARPSDLSLQSDKVSQFPSGLAASCCAGTSIRRGCPTR